MSRLAKANIEVEKGGVSSSSYAKMPPKETSSIIKVKHSSSNGATDMGSSIHLMGSQAPYEGPNDIVPS
jgi:hypothetical protein